MDDRDVRKGGDGGWGGRLKRKRVTERGREDGVERGVGGGIRSPDGAQGH